MRVIECSLCSRDFEAQGVTERDCFPGTTQLARVEWVADSDECPDCLGDGTCESCGALWARTVLVEDVGYETLCNACAAEAPID